MALKHLGLAASLALASLHTLHASAQTAAAPAALPPVSTIASLDVPRYMGTWYEIAKFPNRFQAKCTANTRAQYLAQTDGSVQVLNSCTAANGTIDALGLAKQVGSHIAQTASALCARVAELVATGVGRLLGD